MAKYEDPIAQAARFRDNMPFDGVAAFQRFLQAAATPVVAPPPYGNAREPQPGIGFGPPEAPNMRANINRSGPIRALSDVIDAVASTAGPARRGPASSWDVPQAMVEPVIGQRPNPPAPISLQDILSSRPVETDPTQFRNAREPQPGTGFGPPEATNMRANINQSGPIGALQSLINSLTAQSPEALGPNAPPNTVATRISNASMRAPVGNGIVSNAGVSGTYAPPDPTNLDIYGPGIVLPGGNVLGGITAEERTPRRPETLPIYSSAAPARQNTAPLPAREDRARGEPYVTAAQASAPKAGDIAGSPISVVRALQNTNYLPVLDAQGRVSYQSEDFMREQAARAAAAQKGAAETRKIEAETAKAAAVLPIAKAQENAYNRMLRLQDTLDRTPRDAPDYKALETEYKWLYSVLQPKIPGAELQAFKDYIQ